MMRIAYTGANGFFGKHFGLYFYPLVFDKEVELVPIDRKIFNDDASLQDALCGVDVVVHLAGVNRGSDEEVQENIFLAERLVSFCERVHIAPHIVYASSTHINRDTVYGEAKKKAGEILQEWGNTKRTPVHTMVFPNLYGEFSKPFYNSAIATLCYQLAHSEQSDIHPEARVELLYVQDAVSRIHESIKKRESGIIAVPGTEQALSNIYEFLQQTKNLYHAGEIPVFKSETQKKLTKTLFSFIVESGNTFSPTIHSDERGVLFELMRHNGPGQTYISITEPGMSRGNHFHREKYERLCVVSGEGLITRRSFFSGSAQEFVMTGHHTCVDVPAFYIHTITNTGVKPLVTVSWASEKYDPEFPDTYANPASMGA